MQFPQLCWLTLKSLGSELHSLNDDRTAIATWCLSRNAGSTENCCAIELRPMPMQNVSRRDALLHAWSSCDRAAAGML